MRFSLLQGLYYMSPNSIGSGETALKRSLALAFAGRLCDKYLLSHVPALKDKVKQVHRFLCLYLLGEQQTVYAVIRPFVLRRLIRIYTVRRGLLVQTLWTQERG